MACKLAVGLRQVLGFDHGLPLVIRKTFISIERLRPLNAAPLTPPSPPRGEG